MKSSARNQLAGLCRTIVVAVLVFVVGFLGGPAQAAQDKKPILCQGNYQSQEDAKKQLAKFAETYSNLRQPVRKKQS